MPVSEILQLSYSIDWLIRGIIEVKGLFLIFGDPASGKSFLAVDMACCVATGLDWHSNKVQAGCVFYIAGEGNRGYSARSAAWSVLNDTSLDDAPLFFSNNTINISDPQSVIMLNDEITAMTNQTGLLPRLIIIDTLARAMDGDENSSRDMTSFVQQLDQLKDLHKCAILLVHHTGHSDKSRARGSTVLKGALDGEYRVTKTNDGTVRLECTKMKESEAPASMAFKLTDVQLPALDDEGNPVYKAAIECIDYSEPARPSSAGMGKNQKLGLSALNELIAEQQESQTNDDPDAVWVTVDDWRKHSETKGLIRQRFNEVKKSLLDAELIIVDDQGNVRANEIEPS